MINPEIIEFHIKENISELESSTKPIYHKTGCKGNWYFFDLYNTFKHIMPDHHIRTDQMLQVLKSLNHLYVITENKNTEKIIVSKKKDYDENVVKEILNLKIAEKDVKPVHDIYKKLDNMYDSFSDEDSCPLSASKNVPLHLIKQENKYKRKDNYNDKYEKDKRNTRNYDERNNRNFNDKNYSDRNNENRFKRRNDDHYERRMDEWSNKNNYKDDGFKNKRIDSRSNKDFDNKKDKQNILPIKLGVYEDYRKVYLAALKHSQAFMVSTFHDAILKVRSQSISHKNAPSTNKKLLRSKLSDYLADCFDIFEKIQIGNMIFFKLIDSDTLFLTEKRRNAHISTTCNNRKELILHIEIIIVNIFPVKTTCDVEHIDILFEKIYQIKLSRLHGKKSIVEFFKEIKSPNLILKNSSGVDKITCIPTHSEEYKLYGDENLHNQILLIEENILKNIVEPPKLSEQVETRKPKIKENEIFSKIIPTAVKLGDLFKITDPSLLKLLDIAELGVPRSIQKNNNLMDVNGLLKKCESNRGYDPIWNIIHQNVKISRDRTYFEII